jgi:RimJ/RimL family protein N-acetyltransferase
VKLVTDKPGEPPVLWRWSYERNRLPWSSDLRMIGLMRDDGTIAATVGFNGWQTGSAWMHVAFDTPHSLTRPLLRAAFEYPFVQSAKEAVYAQIAQDNDEALKFVPRLGFREVYRTVDCVLFEMKAGECRWIKEKEHGKEFSTATA